MNSNKEKIKKIIHLEIEKTSKNVLQLREFTKPIAPDCAIGRISRMDAINNKAINENALRKAETKLKGLQIALQNIDDTNFGICLSCNTAIPLGRILLMPHSPYCVHCTA